jgi:hypothetical protein
MSCSMVIAVGKYGKDLGRDAQCKDNCGSHFAD